MPHWQDKSRLIVVSLDMERTMSTMSLDVTSVRPRRVLRWAAMIGGAAATAVVIGLLTAHSTATDTKAGAHASLS